MPRRNSFVEMMTRQDYDAVRAQPAMEHGTTKLNGQVVRYSNGAGFLHSVQEIFYDEVYLFKTALSSPRIIDAGANIGLSVLYFKQLYPGARIIAFEPDQAIFSLLCENVAHLSEIQLRQAAAWTEDTTLTFFSEGSLAGSSEIDFRRGGGTVIEVKAERLKNFLSGEPTEFLKIDIEGAENSVIFDIADELDNVQHLFFEYHSIPGKDQMLGTMLDLVRSKGFRYVINGAHGPLHPFTDKVNRGFDLQVNVSCFRH